MTRYLPCVTASLALWLAASAWGQWSVDPRNNTPLADAADATQVQPQVAAAPGGQWWVSWFSRHPQAAPLRGYDVHLQRLDANGTAQWAPPGIEVAQLGVGWTENYGLTVDAQGNALLAFQDDRPQPPARRITAAKIDGTGAPLWGNQGVAPAPAPSSGDQHAPHIAALPDGQSIVGWTQGDGVYLQKLDAQGRPLWPSGALVLAEADHRYALADLRAAGDGSVIAAFVRNRGFSGARHLYTNKVSASGALLWGAGHVRVFDGGSLQMGNFPHFVPDGRGGAVFAWYSVAPQMQVHAQHIQADGKAAFAHNGVAASTQLRQARANAALSYQPATREITLFWTEFDSSLREHQHHLYAQKIDAHGTRQWGEAGRRIRPAQEGITHLRSIAVADGTLAFWIESQAGQAHNSIQAIKLDGDGHPLCPAFAVSTRPSGKTRLVAGMAATGQILLAWEDQTRSRGSDIYLQSLRADCALR